MRTPARQHKYEDQSPTRQVWGPQSHNTSMRTQAPQNKYEDPRHTTPTHREKEEKGKTGKKRSRAQQNSIGPAFKPLKSHNIKYRVGKIVPQRYWERNESPVIPRGSAARRRISMPMCAQSTACAATMVLVVALCPVGLASHARDLG